MGRFIVREGHISSEVRRALRDHAARIKHDLGKYVAFQARWLPEEPADEELREALLADLLSTRRGPDGSVDARTVWLAFRSPLVGEELLEGQFAVDLRGQAAFEVLDAAMTALSPHIDALQSGDETPLGAARVAALGVAEACRTFLTALREQT